MEDSRNWRAPFRALTATGKPRPYHYRPPTEEDPRLRVNPRESEDMVPTWHLARRLEAAIRVACNPLPWIRRLAVRIRRKVALNTLRLGRPKSLRHPRAIPTLNTLNAIAGLGTVQAHDSS